MKRARKKNLHRAEKEKEKKEKQIKITDKPHNWAQSSPYLIIISLRPFNSCPLENSSNETQERTERKANSDGDINCERITFTAGAVVDVVVVVLFILVGIASCSQPALNTPKEFNWNRETAKITGHKVWHVKKQPRNRTKWPENERSELV